MKITGLKILKQKIINNKKGDILKFLSKRDSFFKKFGEIYFTEIKKTKQKVGIITRKIIALLQFHMARLIFGLLMDVKILQVIIKRIQ